MESISKIVLGTVQFGCQYGINSNGKPNKEEVCRILQYAAEIGITKLDTSSAYGNAESVIGQCMPNDNHFKIISKYPKSNQCVKDMFFSSLQRLKVPKMYGYLLHHFDLFQSNEDIWTEFIALRNEGLVDKIGFSLYHPKELELLIEKNIEFQLLQIPRNLFDRKFDKYLAFLEERNVEIHVRSTFLQGLFFKDKNLLPQKLQPLKKYLLRLDDYAKQNNETISQVALNYNLQNPYISGTLIGVDNQKQLEQNIASIVERRIECDIKVEEQELLNPINWS